MLVRFDVEQGVYSMTKISERPNPPMTPPGSLYLSLTTLSYGALHVGDKIALNTGCNATAYTISRVFIAALIFLSATSGCTLVPLVQETRFQLLRTISA